jgi:H+/Cl- antiporter ClcA
VVRNFKNNSILFFSQVEQAVLVKYMVKWIFISLIIGSVGGSASAVFLFLLDWVTDYRESHTWIIALLPIAGLIVGLLYFYFGKGVESGSNVLIQEIHDPKKVVPFKMAPLVLLGTLITHLFGGSAGREGTAVQMGGALADQINRLVKLTSNDRTVILICGISAGFSSVFGTPLAGAIFSLEVFLVGRLRYNAFLPSLLSAIIADLICDGWGIKHTVYIIDHIPPLTFESLFLCMLVGIIFGLTAVLFIKSTYYVSKISINKISYPPLRPALGGVIIAAAVLVLGTTKYIGLGIPTIVDSFHHQLPYYDFLLKIAFTALTLGVAFKGGEVTPLFFIGAVLGNALSLIIPLPMALLAGLGFVAVFSGAANTPLATTLMAIELFGMEIGVFAAITCVISYIFSGRSGIYSSQVLDNPKSSF